MENKIDDYSLIPLGTTVIVRIKRISETTADAGIYLPKDKIDRDQQTLTEGEVFALGDYAFQENIEDEKEHPRIGDTVFFKTYSGILHYPPDVDGKKSDYIYRFINDIDVYTIKRGPKHE